MQVAPQTYYGGNGLPAVRDRARYPTSLSKMIKNVGAQLPSGCIREIRFRRVV